MVNKVLDRCFMLTESARLNASAGSGYLIRLYAKKKVLYNGDQTKS